MSKVSPRGAALRGGVQPIVGRSAEQVLLREQLLSVRASQGQFCIISGEAGIGKTTLVREMIEEARGLGMTTLVGQCYDLMAAPPYGLWLDLASSYRPNGDAVPLPGVLSRGRVRDVTSQTEVFEAVRDFLARASAARPTLVVLEDVHWADPVSIELLRHISTHLRDMRLCMVITYRVDELTARNPLYRQLPALIRESGGLRVDLARLQMDDLAELVRARYAMPEEDQQRLVEFLTDHSDGNPFFAVELLRALEDRGTEGGLWRDREGWRLGELAELVVPVLVRQVIDLRIGRLGPEVREPLALAAVIGQDVSLALWRRLAKMDEPAMITIVDKAVEWHVLGAAADGARVRFVHALTREALYESILPPRRRLLHRDVAEALMEMPQVDADAVAYHLQRAGDHRTAEWMIRAGEGAQRAYAWLTAWDRLSAAAAALADVPGQELLRARLLYRCGRLLRYANAGRGIEDIRLARRLADAAGERVLAAEATYSQGLLQNFADDWSHGVAAMEDGVRQLEALPIDEAKASWSTVAWIADVLPVIDLATASGIDPAAERLAEHGVTHRRGSLHWWLAHSGRLEEARSGAEAFIEHDVGDVVGPLVMSSTGHAWFGLAVARSALGDPAGARTAFLHAREIYLGLDHHAVIAFTLLIELQDVVLRYETSDLARRRDVAAAARAALGRAGGALPSDLSLRRAELPLMVIDGRWDEAREVASESTTHGNYVLRRTITNSIPWIDYYQGRPEAVRQHIREFLPAGPDASPGSFVLPDALLLQQFGAMLAMDASDYAVAGQWLASNLRWLEWSGSVPGWAEHWLLSARHFQETGEPVEAMNAAERAVECTEQPFQPLARVRALRMRGGLRGDRGDARGADADLREALMLADACAAPFERALTLVALAKATGDLSGLDDAERVASRLRAVPLLASIVAVQGSTRREADLTAREMDVLRLAAQGLTDVEIGERLFISHRTVSQHLRSVYGKLNVRSRAAATRFAVEHQLG